MAKNIVKISFQTSDGKQNNEVAEAISNLSGNEIAEKMKVQWKISHVTLGEHVFYRTEYSVEGTRKISKETEQEIRSIFDSYTKMNLDDLSEKYKAAMESSGFRVVKVEEVKEEYNLWQDKLFSLMGRQGNN
jgi:FtsZ-binding cell division protein ZapB